MNKLRTDGYRFLPVSFLADTLMIRQDLVVDAFVNDMDPRDRAATVDRMVNIGSSWKHLYRAVEDHFGITVLIGGMDQMGCPWDESEGNPQLAFRVARGVQGYSQDERNIEEDSLYKVL